MSIHPSAHIHPNARIGEGTRIGPGVIIEEHVEIGPDCEIRAHAVLSGHTRIGARNQIGYGAVIGAEPQDLGYRGAVTRTVIGDDNVFREHVTIHRGTKEGTSTEIGNHCFLMAGAHVAHNCRIGDHVILVNNVLLAGHVEVEERAFVGGAVVIHQFTRIGRMSMIRGLTALGMDVPPYCMAVALNSVAGLNRVGLKRNGAGPAVRKALWRAYTLFYESGLNRIQALEAIAAEAELDIPEVRHFTSFIRATRRGVCRAVKASEVDPADG